MTSNFRQIYRILTAKEKRRFILLTMVLMGMGLLEFIGIASILPFISLIANPEVLEGEGIAGRLFRNFGFESHRQFIIWTGIASFALIISSNLLRLYANWSKFKLTWKLAHRLSVSLLDSYFRKPYTYFLDVNSANLTSYIVAEATNISKGIVIPFLELVGRIFLILVILVLLLWVNVSIALVMFGTLGSAYIIIYLLQRQRLSDLGERRILANTQRFRSLIQLFNGIKTIRVSNREGLFHDSFRKSSAAFSSIQPRYHITVVSPRFLLEILAFGSMIGIIMYLYLVNGNIQEIIPTLSLYAVAGYRLLPALQNAFTTVSNLRHNWPTVNRIYPELLEAIAFEEESKAPSPVRPALQLQQSLELIDINFSYPNAEVPALSQINLQIKAGETVAFVGSTGSGKTTLVDLIVGLLPADSGVIKLDGKAMDPTQLNPWRQSLAYVPQDVFLFDHTVARNITMTRDDEEVNQEAIIAAAKLAGVHEFIQSLTDQYETMIGERGVRLSGGQRQRLGLARALYSNPSLLILDEATSALDNVTEKGIVDALDSLPHNITTILIAHRLSTVKRADRIYLLDNGRIVQYGTYSTLLQTSSLFQEMVQPR